MEGFRGAQTIQGSALMFRFSSECANYSSEQTVQGGILFKEIRYTKANKGIKFGISGFNGLCLKSIIGIDNVLSVNFSTTSFYKFPMIVLCEY